MRIFNSLANALRDIKEGLAEGQRQAKARRLRDAAARQVDEVVRANPGLQLEIAANRVQEIEELGRRLAAAAHLPTDQRDAVAREVDESMRGNPLYEQARARVLGDPGKPSSEA